MVESIEAELRLLVQQVSKRATQIGGMDRLTYDALRAASAALSSLALAGSLQGQEEALHAVQARLHACTAEPRAKVA